MSEGPNHPVEDAERVPAGAGQPAPFAEPAETPSLAALPGEHDPGEFARLLQTSQGPGVQVTVGERISGVVAKIEDESTFIDFGGRSEGVMRTQELRDEGGRLLVAVGDPLEAYVASVQDEVLLTRRVGQQDRQADLLYQAYKSGIPVEGRVDAVNKWGLGVTLQGGVRAFCPISQVDTTFVENAEDYRGQTITFRITEFRHQGRTIVLSRRAMLEAEQDRQAEDVRGNLQPGAEVEGKVTRLEDFGAFVELGAGIEGLIHVSELSHKRVRHPQDVLSVGQTVRVAVLQTKGLGERRRERISLSLKALERDPWEEARRALPAGTVVDGRVDAVETFGAFVEVAPGIRGLLHVSEIADRRIGHPREVLEVGQQVRVVVLEIDARRRRVRLSMRQVESLESAANLKEFQDRQRKAEDEQGSTAMRDALRRANLID
ncbi:MAG: 30S ribosomal protein S1 [Candidatus Latescibacterota bacterium]